MSRPELHDDDRRVAQEVTARDRSNLFLTSQFLRERTRYDAFLAMYAVMRVIDDAIDDVPDKHLLPASARSRLHTGLAAWDARIRAAYEGQPDAQPLDRALAWAVAHFPVPLELWVRFVEAMHYDVDHPRFADFGVFVDYAEGATVAPTTIYLYLLTSEPDGAGVHRVEGFDYRRCGRELGLFAYLAHVLRDVRRDALVGQRGLVYLSEADLAACGLDDGDLRRFAEARRSDDRFARLVALVADRARAHAERGERLVDAVLPQLPPDRGFVLRLIVAYYREMLARIADPGLDLFAVDEVLATSDKLAIALRVAAQSGLELDVGKLAGAAGPG